MTEQLTLNIVKSAVAGSAAAFRRVVELQPAGGPGAKVFPPTYEGGKYATEKRRINGETLDCVLLDSVQSQANRMEAALQEAWEQKRISLPVITVDFANTVAAFAGQITSLQAPHRIADAILRDSTLDGTSFRESRVGKLLDEVSVRNATALFEYCPTALVFGMWDSTGARGGAGAKFARAVVSEIIGIGVMPGQRTSSRIDPLQIGIKGNTIYATENDGWTIDPSHAKQEKGKPVLYGKKGKPSELNHGNVTPSFAVQKDRDRVVTDKDGNPIPIGGFTVDKAQQSTVISLPALRRLKFPVNGKSVSDTSAQTVLTALALCAATLASEQGYDLRSQCMLVASSPLFWELIGVPGEAPQMYGLNSLQAIKLFEQAVVEATAQNLPWKTEGVTLLPRADLAQMVKNSVTQVGAVEDGEDA